MGNRNLFGAAMSIFRLASCSLLLSSFSGVSPRLLQPRKAHRPSSASHLDSKCSFGGYIASQISWHPSHYVCVFLSSDVGDINSWIRKTSCE